MIIDSVLYIFLRILEEIFNLLPEMVSVPEKFDDSITFLLPFWSMANSIFPISTIFQIFLLYLTIEGGLLLFKIFNWIVNKLRGSG